MKKLIFLAVCLLASSYLHSHKPIGGLRPVPVSVRTGIVSQAETQTLKLDLRILITPFLTFSNLGTIRHSQRKKALESYNSP